MVIFEKINVTRFTYCGCDGGYPRQHITVTWPLALCGGMTVLSAPESPVVSLSYPDRESPNIGGVAHLQW